MADEVKLTIDGETIGVGTETTIVAAAEQAGIKIPVICDFAHTTANGPCRMCVVESKGARGLQLGCVTADKNRNALRARLRRLPQGEPLAAVSLQRLARQSPSRGRAGTRLWSR